MMQQSELTTDSLSTLLNKYFKEPEAGRGLLRSMAQSAHALAKPQSTAEVATICANAMGIELGEVA